MRRDQEAYIRDVRGKLAGAIQRAISQLEPFVLAHERRKPWSNVDRADAIAVIEELQAVVRACRRVLAEMPRQKGMSRVDKERFERVVGSKRIPGGLAGAEALCGRMQGEKLIALDKQRPAKRGSPGAGQDYFMALYRQLMVVLRHSLAGLFYLVNDARIRTIRLDEKATDGVRYGSPEVQAALREAFVAQARELATETGNFVEVIAYDGEVLYDASPHAATVRKAMQEAQRKEKRQWPYVANPKQKDYDVLLGLYRRFK